MAKLYKTENWRLGMPDLYFHCPGCECDHGVWLKPPHEGGPQWEWNGDMEKPTFTPSIKVTSRYAGIDLICHMIITNGIIDYTDSTHKLGGQKVEMVDVIN
jgi:hypothetical protein